MWLSGVQSAWETAAQEQQTRVLPGVEGKRYVHIRSPSEAVWLIVVTGAHAVTSAGDDAWLRMLWAHTTERTHVTDVCTGLCLLRS